MGFRLDVYHHNINNFDDEKIAKILEQSLLTNKTLQKIIMSNEKLQAKLDELQASVDEKQAELEANNSVLTASNEALAAAKAALEVELGNSINPEQTQAAIDKIDAIEADVKSTLAGPTGPVGPAPIEPAPVEPVV